jgi:hypothetical protein
VRAGLGAPPVSRGSAPGGQVAPLLQQRRARGRPRRLGPDRSGRGHARGPARPARARSIGPSPALAGGAAHLVDGVPGGRARPAVGVERERREARARRRPRVARPREHRRAGRAGRQRDVADRDRLAESDLRRGGVRNRGAHASSAFRGCLSCGGGNAPSARAGRSDPLATHLLQVVPMALFPQLRLEKERVLHILQAQISCCSVAGHGLRFGTHPVL